MSDAWTDDDWVAVHVDVDAIPRVVLEKALGALQEIDEHPGRRDADTLTGLAMLRLALERSLRD